MAFGVYGSNGQSQSSDSDSQKVDYNEMNRYVVETAGLQERETLIGVVSGIVDLGIQDQEDAQQEFKGTPEEEAKIIAEFPNTYFKDGVDEKTKKAVRLKCWPQKAYQSVAVCVDFPDIVVDKGQFFGESNPQPLRLWLGGQFYANDPKTKGMIIGRPISLKNTTSNFNGQWSFAKNHIFHKMAVAAKLIKSEEPFQSRDIDQLLGKAFQFEAQVFMKSSKGKEYYTEYLKFVAGLGRGQNSPELPNPPFVLEFEGEACTAEGTGQLRSHVINTIKRAHNYEGSKIQKLLEKVSESGDDSEQEAEAPKPVVQKPKPAAKPAETEVEDDDCPF